MINEVTAKIKKNKYLRKDMSYFNEIESNHVNVFIKDILSIPKGRLVVYYMTFFVFCSGIFAFLHALFTNTEPGIFIGIIFIFFSLLLLLTMCPSVLINNVIFNMTVKKNITEIRNELSNSFYYLPQHKLILTEKYIICNFFNKKQIIKYSDITNISKVPIKRGELPFGQTDSYYYNLSPHNYSYNICIKKNRKKFYIPTPNFEYYDCYNLILYVISSKNLNLNIDLKEFN